MTNIKERFPWKPFLTSLAAIAIPIALQNVFATTGSMVDTMMIAQLGQNSVGAVGLCAQFSSLMFSCYWGFVGGGMLFFSQYFGAKDDAGINRSYGTTMVCMMTVAVIFCTLALLFPEAVMTLYTDKTAIREIGVAYLQAVALAYPLQVASMCMAALLRTTDRVKIPFYAAIGSTLTNIVLNYLLIMGRFGFPALGIRGAGYATVMAQVVNLAITMGMAKKTAHPYLFSFRAHFRWKVSALKEYFIKCAPIIANELFIGIGVMLINIVLGHQSEDAIAANAVFRTFEGFVIAFFAGFSNASSVLVGTQIGAGNIRVAFERAVRIVYLCMGVIACLVMVLLLLHSPMLHLMGLQGEAFRLCFGMLCIYGVGVIIRMGNWTMNDTYRASGDAATGTLLEILFMFLMVLPCVFASAYWLKLPFLVIYACTLIDEPVRFFIMQRHLYSAKWIRPVTPEGREGLKRFMANREEGKAHA